MPGKEKNSALNDWSIVLECFSIVLQEKCFIFVSKHSTWNIPYSFCRKLFPLIQELALQQATASQYPSINWYIRSSYLWQIWARTQNTCHVYLDCFQMIRHTALNDAWEIDLSREHLAGLGWAGGNTSTTNIILRHIMSIQNTYL